MYPTMDTQTTIASPSTDNQVLEDYHRPRKSGDRHSTLGCREFGRPSVPVPLPGSISRWDANSNRTSHRDPPSMRYQREAIPTPPPAWIGLSELRACAPGISDADCAYK